MLEQVDELNALFINDLIARYEVVVEVPSVAMTSPPPGQANELKVSLLVDGVVVATAGSCDGGRISSGAAGD